MISDAMRERAEVLCSIAREVTRFEPTGRGRSRGECAARMFVARQLYDEGLTEMQVGELIGRDHATINYYKRRFSLLNSSGWEPELEMWGKFHERVSQTPRDFAAGGQETGQISRYTAGAHNLADNNQDD